MLAVTALLVPACSGDDGADTQAGTGGAASLPVDDVSGLADGARQKFDLPALAAAMGNGSQLLAVGAAGVRKMGDPTEVTVDDRWHLGSNTKAMTATVMALLVEDGTIEWELTLPQAFPSLAAKIDPGLASVTLEDLLQHRGGLSRNFSGGMTPVDDERPLPEQRFSLVEQLLEQPPSSPVGSYQYSNAGYVVVGAALEVATGKSWEQLVQERLFEPLAMTDCGFGPPDAEGTLAQPWGHAFLAGEKAGVDPTTKFADLPPTYGPAGTAHCSLESWNRFLGEHLKGARGESSFLSTATYTRMHTPPTGGGYAHGWVVGERAWAKGTVLVHDGTNAMFYSVAWLAPNTDRTYMATTNWGGDDNGFLGIDMAVESLITKYPQ